jgi:hypothetical protein
MAGFSKFPIKYISDLHHSDKGDYRFISNTPSVRTCNDDYYTKAFYILLRDMFRKCLGIKIRIRIFNKALDAQGNPIRHHVAVFAHKDDYETVRIAINGIRISKDQEQLKKNISAFLETLKS